MDLSLTKAEDIAEQCSLFWDSL